jgi:tRNA(Ile)-lysidine synthase
VSDPVTVDGLSDYFNDRTRSLLPGDTKRVAVAVSGGSDSMALALLAKDWATRAGISLLALTVDHGLRPESAREAEIVSEWLNERGIETRVLRWNGPYPESGIQDAARNARYTLMEEACVKAGISSLLLGHQLEDQLETLLMRLSKGSGLDGLSAMENAALRGKLTLLRPLLSVRRQVLRDYLKSLDQGWIDDPSNENPVYTRTRVGAVLGEMQQLPGSSLETIALSLSRLQRASRSLDGLAMQIIETQGDVSPFGFVRLPLDSLENCPDELALRILSIIFRACGGGQRIKLTALEKLYQQLFKEKRGNGGTIAGAQIQKSRGGWLFCREPGRAGLPSLGIEKGEGEWVWDNRFIISYPSTELPLPPGLTVGPLGKEGWQFLSDRADASLNSTVPARVRETLPAIWADDKIVALPLSPTGKTIKLEQNLRFHARFRAFYWMTDPNS